MKKNLLKLIFVGLLATIFTSCGSSGGSSTATNVDDNSTAEKAEADRLAAEKAEADRLAAEKAKEEAANAEPEVVETGNWKILPF